ncbi:MAG: hypothetical protein IT378_23835, partial [Sandaracinaceae bacterium]|nr:hypothetical protein [Sandaracinaceae bacterium]
HAALLLDGQPVANPYRGELPLGSRHRIEASAGGHRSRGQSVRIASGMRAIELELEALPPPRAAPARPTPPAARPARPPVARPERPARPARPARRGGFTSDNPY